jgi:hypothetical protein
MVIEKYKDKLPGAFIKYQWEIYPRYEPKISWLIF